MGHSVGDAAKRSTERGERKSAAARTDEQIIADIRRNLDAKLAVTPDDQRFLLAAYDKALEAENQAANRMLDSIRGSLQSYPIGGGDIGVMTEVERIVKEAVAASVNPAVETPEPLPGAPDSLESHVVESVPTDQVDVSATPVEL
jgi:hypothetical protein